MNINPPIQSLSNSMITTNWNWFWDSLEHVCIFNDETFINLVNGELATPVTNGFDLSVSEYGTSGEWNTAAGQIYWTKNIPAAGGVGNNEYTMACIATYSAGGAWFAWGRSDNNYPATIFYDSGGGFSLFRNNNVGSGNTYLQNPNIALTAGKEYRMVFRQTTTGGQTWVDGVKDQSSGAVVVFDGATWPMRIAHGGRVNNATQFPMDPGDKVAMSVMWTRSLTDSEVDQWNTDPYGPFRHSPRRFEWQPYVPSVKIKGGRGLR